VRERDKTKIMKSNRGDEIMDGRKKDKYKKRTKSLRRRRRSRRKLKTGRRTLHKWKEENDTLYFKTWSKNGRKDEQERHGAEIRWNMW